MRKILFSIFGLIIIVALPFAFWFLQEKESLQVAIIDKTVPNESYREHHGLTWLLNHMGYLKNDDSAYQAGVDYFGFKPDEQNESYELNEIPEDFGETDFIYLADTYGVYQEDLAWNEQSQEAENAPSLVYGGLEMAEWQSIQNQVDAGDSDLVVEFNTLASPTSTEVRDTAADYLGIQPTGWSGRKFNELDEQQEEVPKWVVSRFEETGNSWNFAGAGFVLTNDLSGEILVLSEQEGLIGADGIQLDFTEAGQELFSMEDSPEFTYWFDINEAAESSILANYKWDLSEKGKALLAENGIPSSFPAIVHQQKNTAETFYFAGDFVDIAEVPSFYQFAGFAKVRSWLSFESISGDTSFFWKTYAPMMKKILENTASPETVAAAPELASDEGIAYPARVNGQDFQVYENGEWENFTVKGVNMGMAKPGTFPGEAAITREEYDRWFKQIGEMNANAIRVYTLHPPAFYQALKAYNERADKPIYVYHGIWIDEEPLAEKLDAFDPEITERFQTEIRTLVDVVHGSAEVEPRPGHAAGTYDADISPYVIGWIAGIEWDPVMVDQMVNKYPDLGEFEGKHVYTEGASPMENWIAQQLDMLASYELDNYQSMRPLSFTNWVTTDNLEQPSEPSEKEDIAEIDPNHIKMTGQTENVGMFASYHIYPYYPDFLNLEEKYTEFIDHRGEKNNYAGYLKDLNDSHEMPILVAEFGVPASRGKTHENPSGWNQGFISETQQGDIAQRLYEDILNEGMLGGLVFTWQDEWFKRTWNTMDYDNPDQRPFWSNAQTNEQQFGILSFDRHKVKVNGVDDWETGETLYEKNEGAMQSIEMDHDERYLYIKTTFDEAHKAWWNLQQFHLYFNIRDGKGIPVETGAAAPFNADFHLQIDGKESAHLLVAGDYDSFYYDYAERLEMIPESKEDISTVFHPIRLALSKEFTRPDTGEVFPFSSYETGVLQFGVADPESEDYDSLNDYFYSEETGVLEIRIPWMLLNAKDPGRKEFAGDFWKEGLESSITAERIAVAATLTDQDEKIVDSFAGKNPAEYTWETWELPETNERLKQSYYILQEFFGKIE